MARNKIIRPPTLEWEKKPAPPSKAPPGAALALITDELISPSPPRSDGATEPPPSRLIEGDNLLTMEALLRDGLAGTADLIYIDPPFASKAAYTYTVKVAGVAVERKAYSDTWEGGVGGYLEMLLPRLRLMRELLKDKGVIFVHCDWRADSYIRVLMDEVFDAELFLNSIVWNYGGRGAKATSGQFPRNHDTIFAYGKTKGATLKKVYSERVMTVAEAKRAGIREDARGRFFKTAPRGDYTDSSIEKLEKEGRVHRTSSGSIRIKYFLDFKDGKVIERKLVGDVWDDIPDAMHSPAGERTNYATQKPEALLARIIECATDEGGVVMDLFAGSGTTAAVAERTGRRWLLCEEGPVGLHLAKRRLIASAARPFTVEYVDGHDRPGTKSEEVTLSVSPLSVKVLPGGKRELTVSLEGYSLHDFPGDIKVDKNFEALRTIEAIDREDFSILIDYWCVDWDHDGTVFNGTWQSARTTTETVKKVASVVVDGVPGRVTVRVVDIFGNVTEETVETDGEA